MCQTCMSRRSFLRYGAVGAPVALAGCDGLPDLVSDAEVEAMGLQGWQEITQTTPVSRDRTLQDALNQVSRRILGAMEEDPSDWEFVVFAEDSVNAFALPGRKIGVYEGMFGVADTPDQRATIVGHEIGHIEAEHAQERMSAEVARSAGLRILAFFLNLGDVEFANEIAAALGIGIQYGLVLPYSRNQELEADRLGLQAMANAGYQPEAAVTLWQKMERQSAGRGPEFLATHPAPSARIDEIRQILPSLSEA